jgi:hypothetical protein
MCRQMCATNLTCGNISTQCELSCEMYYAHCRPEFRDGVLGCFNKQCAKDQEMCNDETIPLIPRRPVDDEFLSACLSVYGQCGDPFPTYYCRSEPFTETAVATAMACLSDDCATVQECLESALAGWPRPLPGS